MQQLRIVEAIAQEYTLTAPRPIKEAWSQATADLKSYNQDFSAVAR
jgi:hypothetical protein